MSIVLDVIEAGYRRSGVKSAGSTLNSVQYDVGFERLQALFREMADTLFGAVDDYALPDGTTYEAKEFERVLNRYGAVVTFPATVRDLTSGEERLPVDCAVIVVVVPGTEPHVWVYENNRGEWIDTTILSILDQCPFTTRWDEGVKNLLAVSIADDVGGQITPFLAKRASSARLLMASRHGSRRKAAPVEFF